MLSARKKHKYLGQTTNSSVASSVCRREREHSKAGGTTEQAHI